MASCIVNRDDSGNIKRVNTSEGVESTLYNAIVRHPMVETPEVALNIYKNAFTPKVDETSQWIHRLPDGAFTTSYKQALEETPEGSTIEVGFFSDEKGFTSIIPIVKTTNKDTERGYINHLIVNNYLSDQKERSGNDYYFAPQGVEELEIAVKANLLQEDAFAYLGTEGVQRFGNLFKLRKTKGRTRVIAKNGQALDMDPNELDTQTFQELDEKYEDAVDIIAEREYTKSQRAYSHTDIANQPETERSEEDLKLRLLTLLNKMGVKVTSITKYTQNYKIKHGVNPSAQALADIANQVVAFRNGEIRLDELTEETAHFIVEAMPQSETVDVLRNIHRSEEWQQHSESYRLIYSEMYSGEVLEQAVRREVLGKIVANSIKTNFNKEGKSSTQQNFIDKAAEFIQNFFNTIAAYFKPQYKTELDTYLENIQQIIYAEDISNTLNSEQFKDNKFVLYSTPNNPKEVEILNKAKGLVSSYEKQLKNLRRTGQVSRTNLRKVRDIQEKLENAEQKGAVASLLSMINNDVNKLEAALDAVEREKADAISNEENIVFQNLIHNLNPTLSEIRSLVSGYTTQDKDWKKLHDDLGETVIRVDDLRGREANLDTQTVEKLVQKIIDKHNIPESSRKHLTDWIKEAKTDTSWFHATFGQTLHAKDGMINVLGVALRSMNNKAHVSWFDPFKGLQQVMRENGISAKEIGKRFFVKGGYILNERDMSKFDEVMNFIHAKNYKKVTGSDKTLDELIEAERLGELEGTMTTAQEVKYRDLNREEEAIFKELPFTQEYYDEADERYKGLSQVTRELLRDYYADLGALKKAAFTEVNGKQVLNFQNLTPQQRQDLERLHQERANWKSYVDTNGELKQGLFYTKDSNGDIVFTEEESIDAQGNKRTRKGRPVVGIVDNASDEARVAYDMNNLDSSFRKNQGGDAIDTFYSMLGDVQEQYGREEALKFLELNAYLGFTEEFWSSLGESESITDQLLNAREAQPENYQVITELVNNIIETNTSMKGIMRLYQKKNNPSEIDVESMTSSDRDRVKVLREALTVYYEQAKEFATFTYTDSSGESSANEAYLNLIQGLNLVITPQDTYQEGVEKINQEMEEARKHMTDDNKGYLSSQIHNFDRFMKGDVDKLNKGTQRILDRLEITPAQLKASETLALEVRLEIVRAKLLPYYKRFTPQDFNVQMASIRESRDIATSLRGLVKTNPYITVQPNYSFFDQGQNQQLNTAYDTQYKGGYNQPKLGQIQIPSQYQELINRFGSSLTFESQQFKDTFGSVTKNADGTRSSSNNQKLFNVYENFMQFHFDALDAMGVSAGHNRYTAPQIRKNKLERVTKFLSNPSAEAVRNAFKELNTFTEDDMVKGETQYGTDVKVIPRMYTKPLEDPEDISSELFYSVSLFAKEAYLRKARVEAYGDVMSVYNKILTREYEGTGKVMAETNTYKMVKSAVDFNMFGIKEVRTLPVNIPLIGKVDMAKVARNLLSYIKFRNLGFNVIIPLTSYLTGGVFQKIEVVLGEYLHSRSQKMGTKEFRRLSSSAMKEVGSIDPKAKINVLGQYFRAFDMQDTIQNSNYGWVARAMPRLGMMLHTMANFPIYAKTFMGVMHDYRIVEGKIVNFNAFKGSHRNLSKKELEAEWNKYEGDVFYKYVDVVDGQVTFDKAGLSSKLNLKGEELDKYIDSTVDTIQQYVTTVNEFVDGQLTEDDRVYAQRDALFDYFMTHRGWLSIITARRFKNRHLNATLGMEEEGSYRSVWNFIGEYLKEFNGKNISQLIQNGKEVWNRPPIPEDAVVKNSNYNNFTSFLKNAGSDRLQKGDYVKQYVGDNIKYYYYKGGDTTKSDSYTETSNELQQRNIKRVMVEIGVINTVILLSFILNKLADDDDNKDLYALQAGNYLMIRTLNEMSSSQLAIANNYSDVIDQPFVGWNTAKDLTNALDLFSSEEVKYGNYRGMSERRRWLTKVMPAMKQYHDLTQLNSTKNTYLYYNNSNFKPNALGFLDWDKQ